MTSLRVITTARQPPRFRRSRFDFYHRQRRGRAGVALVMMITPRRPPVLQGI